MRYRNLGVRKKAFTIIELLVVISIISALSSVVLASLQTARSKARDIQRRQTIVQLRNALELYYSKNGHYPITGVAGGGGGGDFEYQSDDDYSEIARPLSPYFSGTNGGNWIPGLVADGDIAVLPHDPRPGVVTACAPNWWDPESATYVYRSINGTGYALADICGSEAPLSASDPMIDSHINASNAQDFHTMKVCNQAVPSTINGTNLDECLSTFNTGQF